MTRVFLLSPAYAGGRRAQMIMSDRAQFDLALRLRSNRPPSLGEVFAFLSGLYFKGKLAYANAFAPPRRRRSSVLIITPTRGLVPASTPIRLADLREFAEVDIHENDPRYRGPLERDVKVLATKLRAESEIVLLGSIATAKYMDVLPSNISGQRLCFPPISAGRGDMSRGGLLSSCVCAVDGCELSYISVAGAVRKASARQSSSREDIPNNGAPTQTAAPADGSAPVDNIPVGDEWQYEPKWDGFAARRFEMATRFICNRSRAAARALFSRCRRAAATSRGETIHPRWRTCHPGRRQAVVRRASAPTPSAASRVQKLAAAHPALFIVSTCSRIPAENRCCD